ncbi:MAG: hypothetical protein R3E97_12645 [Candidatus Eisenbacteria bacterium]
MATLRNLLAAIAVSAMISSAPSSAAVTGWEQLLSIDASVEAVLGDGTTLVGTVEAFDADTLTLATTRFGTLVLSRSEVKSLRVDPPSAADDPSSASDGETSTGGTAPGAPPEEPGRAEENHPVGSAVDTVPPAASPTEPATAAGSEAVEAATAATSESATDGTTRQRRYENGWYVDPDYNSLLLVPTSETLPVGDSYYRNFELLFNNAGFSLTDDVNLSFMAAFPVTSDFTVFGAGAKFRIVRRDEVGIGLALAGSINVAGSETVGALSAITSIGDKKQSMSLAFNVGMANGEAATFILAGLDAQFAPRAKLLAEYGNSTEHHFDDGFYGIVNVGIRVFWDSTSFTITGLRPLASDLESFIAFPLVSFSAHF